MPWTQEPVDPDHPLRHGGMRGGFAGGAVRPRSLGGSGLLCRGRRSLYRLEIRYWNDDIVKTGGRATIECIVVRLSDTERYGLTRSMSNYDEEEEG